MNATPSAPTLAAPANLSATAGNAQVSLAWSSVSGATGYLVKRSTTSGTEMQIASSSAITYTDTTAKNGTKYFYAVSAVDAAGQSANSNEVSATPVPPAQAPPVPMSLAATAGNAQVALTWSASTGATSYHVKTLHSERGRNADRLTTTNSYTDTTATNGTKYFYVVSAVNSTGESANSSEVSATLAAPAQAPPAPMNLAATAGNAQVSLTWSASTGATSYHVKRSTTPVLNHKSPRPRRPLIPTSRSPTAQKYF